MKKIVITGFSLGDYRLAQDRIYILTSDGKDIMLKDGDVVNIEIQSEDVIPSVESVKLLMDTDDQYLSDAILAVYRGQTASEQSHGQTIEDNGIGFNGADSNFGTSLAKQILAGRKLSEKQQAAARRMMKKYAKQVKEVLHGS